jgi:hypothetical protein
VLLSVLLLAVTIAGFVVVLRLVGPESRAGDANTHLNDQPTRGGVSPAPGSTPLPRGTTTFHGEINGISLGVTGGSLPHCNRTVAEPDWPQAVRGTPFDLHFDALPPGVTLQDPPRVGRCADDGRIIWIIANLEVAHADLVQVSRWEAVRWYPQEFLADSIMPTTIAGRPGIAAGGGAAGSGPTGVFVRDDEIEGSTALLSSDVRLDDLQAIAEAIYR